MNDNLRQAIENLSTTESDSDDFTFARALYRGQRLMEPHREFGQPYKAWFIHSFLEEFEGLKLNFTLMM